MPDRIQINKLGEYLKNNPISHFDRESMTGLANQTYCTKDMKSKMSVIEGLIDFIHLEPEFPSADSKIFTGPGPIAINRCCGDHRFFCGSAPQTIPRRSRSPYISLDQVRRRAMVGITNGADGRLAPWSDPR